MRDGRIINFRPFLLIAVSMAASVLISLAAFNYFPLGVVLFAVFGGILAALLIMFIVKKNKPKAVSQAPAIILSAVAAISFFGTLSTRYAVGESIRHTYTGRVTEHYGLNDNGMLMLELDSLTSDGEGIDGKMRIYISAPVGEGYMEVGCGYIISFSSRVSHNGLVSGVSVNASGIRSGVRYYAYPDDIEMVAAGSAYGFEKARMHVKDMLFENMDEGSAGVAYGMLVGDRHYLSDDISDAFAASGIGHILAISGLHIGVLAAALSLLLKLIRMPKKASPFIIIGLLILYAVFTGGSPSVIRACIMCAVMLLSPFFGQNDPMNGLMAAACVCLCISPFYLFEAGFVMSVSAVFGLLTLQKPIDRLLRRIRVPKFISLAVSASAAAQIAIIPATAYFFHMFYIYSFFVNVLLMPLLSLLFIVLLACVVIALIVPAAAILVTIAGFPVRLLISGCYFISLLPGAAAIMHVNASAFVALPSMFFVSDFTMLGKRGAPAGKLGRYSDSSELYSFNIKKAAIWLAFAAACALMPFYADSTAHYDNALIALTSGDSIIMSDNTTHLVGNLSGNTLRGLFNARIKGELYVYITDMTESAAAGIIELSKTYAIVEVNIIDYEYTDIAGLIKLEQNGFTVNMTGSSNDFTAAYINGKPTGWLYTSGKTALITSGYAGSAADNAADVIRCSGVTDGNPEKTYLTAYRSEYETVDNIFPTPVYGSVVYNLTSGAVSWY